MEKWLVPAQLITPSWVIEGTYGENLHFLADTDVDGVELLYFIYDKETKDLLDKEFDEICSFEDRFLFTAHLPDKFNESHLELVEKLFAQYGKERFLFENTVLKCLKPLLALLPNDVRLCMDTGHLLVENIQGASPVEYYKANKGRIDEIHLHRVDYEKAKIDQHLPDHRPLKKGEPWLDALIAEMGDYHGVINMEVFSWAEAKQSLEVMKMVN
jgi:hypothetical protein